MDLLEPLALSLAMGPGPELAPLLKAYAGDGVSGRAAGPGMEQMMAP